MNYLERLKIPIKGNKDTIFYSLDNKIMIAKGYNRIVIGGRGPYVEFNNIQISGNILVIPEDQKWRLEKSWSSKIFYIEYRTFTNNIKVYFQKRIVDYADYKIGKFYISVFDLNVDGKAIISNISKIQ
jgi:hypothetical protein